MKPKFRWLICAAFGVALTAAAPIEELPDQQVLTAAQKLKQNLGEQLQAKLQSEGPVAAIDYCSAQAQPLTAQVGEHQGLRVSRITDRPRNPDNAADAQETDLLATMRSDLAGGSLEKVYRLNAAAYVPLIIEAPCLICHGPSLAEPVAKAIAQRYPDDQATGYQFGDLRGAI